MLWIVFYSGTKLWKFNCFCMTKSYVSLLSFTRQTCVWLIFILCLLCISFELFPHVLPYAVKFNFHFVCDPSQSEMLLYSCIYWSHHNKSPCMASCNPLLHTVWKLPCISTSFYSIQSYLCVCVPYPFSSIPPGTQLNVHYITRPATSV